MSALLSQTRFPRAWLLAQKLIGGTPDKKRLALRHYTGQKHILEMGCSVGNIADAFVDKTISTYTGIDIDEAALGIARSRFVDDDRFSFRSDPLEDLVASEQRWDFVLIAGVLHHVDDGTALDMIRCCAALTAEDGLLVVSEPVPLRTGDGVAFRIIHGVEQGQFLRETDELVSLLESSGLTIREREEPLIGPGISPRPKMMRFALITATPERKNNYPGRTAVR